MEKTLKFEEAMARLTELTEALEKGTLPLEEAVLAYEEGMKLVRLCRKQLDEAQSKVTVLANAENEENDL